MNNRKPLPLIPQPVHKTCPICGHASYSKTGIHPQCAITQADEPRRARLAAEKKTMLAKKAAEKLRQDRKGLEPGKGPT